MVNLLGCMSMKITGPLGRLSLEMVQILFLNECDVIEYKGIGETHKKEWIGRLKMGHHIYFCGIQEIQISCVSNIDILGS